MSDIRSSIHFADIQFIVQNKKLIYLKVFTFKVNIFYFFLTTGNSSHATQGIIPGFKVFYYLCAFMR